MNALKKNLEGKSKKWVDELQLLLWTVRVLARGTTKETPYPLMYGFEAVAPTKLALPTQSVKQYSEATNSTTQSLDLDLLDERRKVAGLRAEAYKWQTKMSHDKRICKSLMHVKD